LSRGWPATLRDGHVGLRPLRTGDAAEWRDLRRRNASWLAPWESTSPETAHAASDGPYSFRRMVRELGAAARRGEVLPFAITYDEALAGQLTVAGITRGAAHWASIGYWVDEARAGQGIVPTAVALATDHCFCVLGLHRIEINIKPDNAASRRVVEKLGFREEGLRLRLLHIAGEWADHVSYALTVEEVPDGLLNRWHSHPSQETSRDTPGSIRLTGNARPYGREP
jgi:ribosomal-protein-alanine N-acetyltransferase